MNFWVFTENYQFLKTALTFFHRLTGNDQKQNWKWSKTPPGESYYMFFIFIYFSLPFLVITAQKWNFPSSNFLKNKLWFCIENVRIIYRDHGNSLDHIKKIFCIAGFSFAIFNFENWAKSLWKTRDRKTGSAKPYWIRSCNMTPNLKKYCCMRQI